MRKSGPPPTQMINGGPLILALHFQTFYRSLFLDVFNHTMDCWNWNLKMIVIYIICLHLSITFEACCESQYFAHCGFGVVCWFMLPGQALLTSATHIHNHTLIPQDSFCQGPAEGFLILSQLASRILWFRWDLPGLFTWDIQILFDYGSYVMFVGFSGWHRSQSCRLLSPRILSVWL